VHGSAFGVERRFERVEALRELVVGLAQRGFRFDAELPGQIGQREEHIAQLFGGALRVFRHRRAELARFFVDLVDDVAGGRPVEADGRRTRADLVRALQRGHGARNAGEQPAFFAGRGLFVGFQLFPLFEYGFRFPQPGPPSRATRERRARRREHVRMPPDELLTDRLDRVGDVELARLGGDLPLEHALKQHVAQLLDELIGVAAVDRVQRFVGLLEQKGPQRLARLLPIPWAPGRRPQNGHQPHEPCKGGAGLSRTREPMNP